jgi:hypothetical protein
MDGWAKQRLAELHARAPKKQQASKTQKFAHVPLPWGYRVFAIAGRGAPIILHAIHEQKTRGRRDVAITAALLKQWGVSRGTRTNTLKRLTAAGEATVRYRGKKFRGCPLLTMHIPKTRGDATG